MIQASAMAVYADKNDEGNEIDRMKSHIENTIFSAAKHGFYHVVIYLFKSYSDEDINDIVKYFESFGYGCYIDNNSILEIVW